MQISEEVPCPTFHEIEHTAKEILAENGLNDIESLKASLFDDDQDAALSEQEKEEMLYLGITISKYLTKLGRLS